LARAEVALLGDDLPARGLRLMHLAHEGAVARGLLRRDRDRHRGNTRPSGAGRIAKPLEPCVKRAEPRATGAVVDIDVADPAIGVGVELDVDVARGHGVALPSRHLDEAGCAADAERCGRRRDLHVAGLGHRRARRRRTGALPTSKIPEFCLPPSS
jgi:hypothetical protein